jgi:hypothetical protein
MHRAQIEKLILALFFKKFHVICGILRFITIFIRACKPYLDPDKSVLHRNTVFFKIMLNIILYIRNT